MRRYNPKTIEPKWQKIWEETKIYEATEDPTKPKKFILEYFPYPSGNAMHVGHVRNYAIGDAMARFERMRGANVLHPMGWDAFGLPAENYAIKTGISPQQAITENTEKFKAQLSQMGFSYDWSREINSSDPAYYKWTQWFFKLLFERGLAYQAESLQWWCPVDKTVLANEQVEAGRCWRCGSEVVKKPLKQWFFKITDYADRLADDLDKVDWSEGLKAMQRNWIGKSTGAEIEFKVADHDSTIMVYTTRPDTLYGATFMVLAPEHPLVDAITTENHRAAVAAYVKKSQKRSDIERQETNREKTGVFTGAYAINPINNEKIPVWIADYVLSGYGTGAIMAVPAHDERDFEFANKFDLPIKAVVLPEYFDVETPPKADQPIVERRVVQVTVKHPHEDTYLVLKKAGWSVDRYSYVTGGIEDNEDIIEAAKRELVEEAGYKNVASAELLPHSYYVQFYHDVKKENRRALVYTVNITLKNVDQSPISKEEQKLNTPLWVSADEVSKKVHGEGALKIFKDFQEGFGAIVGEGVTVNSGQFDGLSTSDTREKIVAELHKKGFGKERANYKIRDWLISRQRYWGAPIPIIHCPKDGPVAVPDEDLPVVLPPMKSYEPSGDGRSPLARVLEFVNTTCPTCGGPAERETDTMDGFACSSWYFLRFADPHNDKKPFDADKAKFWLPVDNYIGGAEHAVMHLLYARMWTKVMYDAGIIDFDEPFTALRNHGMILAPDGQKMSKSKGNVIAPDEIIEQGYGADSIRLMELFIGPWNQQAAWSVEGMGGVFRFLQRVWTITQEVIETKPTEAGKITNQSELETRLQAVVHKTIKRVTVDLDGMGYNTAIAGLMEMVNDLYKIKTELPYAVAVAPWREAVSSLVLLLAPFAPHITEELWRDLGNETSVHVTSWPAYDEKLLVEATMTIAVQVNGKVRGEILVASDATKEDIIAIALKDANVKKHLENKEPKKSIYVPNKLVSLVV